MSPHLSRSRLRALPFSLFWGRPRVSWLVFVDGYLLHHAMYSLWFAASQALNLSLSLSLAFSLSRSYAFFYAACVSLYLSFPLSPLVAVVLCLADLIWSKSTYFTSSLVCPIMCNVVECSLSTLCYYGLCSRCGLERRLSLVYLSCWCFEFAAGLAGPSSLKSDAHLRLDYSKKLHRRSILGRDATGLHFFILHSLVVNLIALEIMEI
jgi:hypothetical protein